MCVCVCMCISQCSGFEWKMHRMHNYVSNEPLSKQGLKQLEDMFYEHIPCTRDYTSNGMQRSLNHVDVHGLLSIRV